MNNDFLIEKFGGYKNTLSEIKEELKNGNNPIEKVDDLEQEMKVMKMFLTELKTHLENIEKKRLCH